MKLALVLIISVLIISCSSDNSRSTATNALCTKANLDLSTYKPGKAETVWLPSNPNKSDEDIRAKDGVYVLSASTIHVHDKSKPVPDKFETGGPEFLQFAISYRASSQSAEDKENNIANFSGSVRCLSGLMPSYAGKLTYFSNVPTTIEINNLGSNFIPKTLSTVEFGYKSDQTMKFITSATDKSTIDKIEEINKSDIETITNIYRVSPTSEVYQLQSRVTNGDITLTVINTYNRCVDPNEEPATDEDKAKQEDRTQEESDKLQEKYELCLSRTINLKSNQ